MTHNSEEQLLAEVEALRLRLQDVEADSRLAAIVEGSDDAIIAKTLEGNIISWNAGAERLYGHQEADVVGRSILIVVPEDRVVEVNSLSERVRNRERIPPFETVRVRSNGTRIPVSLSLSPIFDHSGEVVAVSAIARDIREEVRWREKAERLDEIQRLHAEQIQLLNGLDNSSGTLLRFKQNFDRITGELESIRYAISHDLRAPLRAIRGFSEILSRRQRSALDEQGQQFLDNIVEAGKKMDQLLENLLSYWRLGRRGVDHSPVAIRDVFQQLSQDQQYAIEAAQAQIHICADLPTVWGDASLLAQMFGQLLTNAITYHRDDISPQVNVDWYRHADNAVISLRDNGVGIPREYHNKIFDIFQRLQTDEDYAGTGIGLAIVNKIVGLLQGRIWLESVPGSGTTFFVELPLT